MPMKPPPTQGPAALNPRDPTNGLKHQEAITIVKEKVVVPKKGYNAGQNRSIAILADGRAFWMPPHVVDQSDGTLVGSYTVEHIKARGKDTIALRNA